MLPPGTVKILPDRDSELEVKETVCVNASVHPAAVLKVLEEDIGVVRYHISTVTGPDPILRRTTMLEIEML